MSDKPDAPVLTLPVLRAMIDTIDREVVHLFARRNALVAEIAQYKRAHGIGIRDLRREREILDDRCARARQLGLSAELVESIFRLMLWGSRDRQAALKAELPIDCEPRTVAVIGGSGQMGRCMANMFADLGHIVMVADVDTELTVDEAASVADVVIVSVPIDVTVNVIRRIGPRLRNDALLMDVTSTKVAPVQAMLESFGGSVIGTHPMFGPSVHSLQGQRVALCHGRGDEWLTWLKQMFRARGLVLVESTPESHDRAMSIVQVLVHFATEVMGHTLATLDIDLEETLQFASPVYLLELLMTARHFAQSSDLYAAIEMSNPDTPAVTDAFVEAAQRLKRIVFDKNDEAFDEMFAKVGDFFGPFRDQAMEQSSFLIDRLVERM
jgi:chorismate mutase / prephenate dehydrogenase